MLSTPPMLSVCRKLQLFVGILVWFLAEGHSSAKPWQGIIPLHSTRKAVQDLLGNPTREAKYTSSFELPNEIVEFLFAKGGPCGTTIIDSWQVARDTVLNIRVVPRNEVTFQNQKSFVKEQDPTQKNIFYYSDLDEGVRYTVEKRTAGERVISVDYYPTAADRYLSCSSARQAKATPIFEQYGVISTELENAILDNFAIQLIKDPDLTGKVLLNQGQYSPKFAAQKLRRIKNYLFNQRRVPSNRISFEVKRARDFSVTLYLVSKTNRRSSPE